MLKQNIFLILCILSFILSGCMSSRKSSIYKYYQSKNFVNPTQTSVDWKYLYSNNQSSKVRTFLEYSKETKIELNKNAIPYAWQGIPQNWNSNYISSKNKYAFMRKNGVDCTRFLWHLFAKKMKLPYNSKDKNSAILSQTFAQKKVTSELKYFIPIKELGSAFKPRTGDILAFPGHALAVIDAQKCIAIQSASWICNKMSENGSCYEANRGKNAGVTVYKLLNKGDCENGYWKHLDTPKNKFTGAWRHQALNTWIEKLPKYAVSKEVITLVGYNISNRYIYFEGSSHASKTSYARSYVISPKGYKLDVVTLKIPFNARTGKLKIYWGNRLTPNIKMTVYSNDSIAINNSEIFSSN
jgi:hypothetical protein